MKKFLIAALLSAGLLFCQEEAEKAGSGSISLSGVSKYLWRGQNLHDNAALQPGLEGSWKEVTAGFWGSVNFIEEDTKGFAEADFYLSYDKTLPFCEKLAVSVGYNLYTYPQTYDVDEEAVDHEFSLGLAVDVIASPYLIYYLSPGDKFDGLQAQYLEIGAGHDFELKENFTVSVGATAGYALYNTGEDWEKNLSVLGFTINPTYSTMMDISPVFFLQIPLSHVEDAVTYEADYYVGLTVSYGFEF